MTKLKIRAEIVWAEIRPRDCLWGLRNPPKDIENTRKRGHYTFGYNFPRQAYGIQAEKFESGLTIPSPSDASGAPVIMIDVSSGLQIGLRTPHGIGVITVNGSTFFTTSTTFTNVNIPARQNLNDTDFRKIGSVV